jgi:hypothetical protein
MADTNTPVADTPEDEPTWTEAQAAAALAAGWHLYTDEGVALRPNPDSDTFSSPQAVWLHLTRPQAEPLCAQTLAFLQRTRPEAHREVWVYGVTRHVQAALETHVPLIKWLETHEAKANIGWRPIAAFLHTLGVVRSVATNENVTLWYFDDKDGLPVFGTDNPMPEWLKRFDHELELYEQGDEETEGLAAMEVFHLITRATYKPDEP